MIIPINSSTNSQSQQEINRDPKEWAMIELNGEILPPLDGTPSGMTTDSIGGKMPSTVELGLIRFENVSKNMDYSV
jgi:hypothetical protein